MRKNIISASLVFLVLATFSGCRVIGDIFKTGMGVGIFIVVLIIVVVIAIASKFGKKN